MKDELDGFAVLIVDDHPLFRDGLSAARRQQAPKLQVHAVASRNQALELLGRECNAFDLVLLDHCLPGCDGLRGARRLRALSGACHWPDVRCG